jgi:hypothetical protein
MLGIVRASVDGERRDAGAFHVALRSPYRVHYFGAGLHYFGATVSR